MVTSYPSAPFTLPVLCVMPKFVRYIKRGSVPNSACDYASLKMWWRSSFLVTCHITVFACWGHNYFADERVKYGATFSMCEWDRVHAIELTNFSSSKHLVHYESILRHFWWRKVLLNFFPLHNTAILPTLILVFKLDLPFPLIFFCCGHQCFCKR